MRTFITLMLLTIFYYLNACKSTDSSSSTDTFHMIGATLEEILTKYDPKDIIAEIHSLSPESNVKTLLILPHQPSLKITHEITFIHNRCVEFNLSAPMTLFSVYYKMLMADMKSLQSYPFSSRFLDAEGCIWEVIQQDKDYFNVIVKRSL